MNRVWNKRQTALIERIRKLAPDIQEGSIVDVEQGSFITISVERLEQLVELAEIGSEWNEWIEGPEQ